MATKGQRMQDDLDPNTVHDPGDAVPEGVAVQEPAPLSEHDKAVKRRLEDLPKSASKPEENRS
jgi:hypothetical protein